ncbi:MAG: hypothetical protein JOZ08_13155 [Verrucomicrobia bacterium]|nr:hypothetical protein [Verrucomicrobiota bacterium]MBV8275959.1 hypothetical protein [Verrucomicrobiota bacterium]
MKNYVGAIIVAVSLFPWCGRGEEGASGHYLPGLAADFMDALLMTRDSRQSTSSRFTTEARV